jgi:glycosyltransferase involved in cell wall biosynthesis
LQTAETPVSYALKEMPFHFITAIPLNVWKGSGCFVGIDTLAKGIRTLGGEVNFVTPEFSFPFYAAKRTVFNHMLRYREFSHCDTIVGFDADGFSIAGRHSSQHVASIKGVIADVLPYETGATRERLAYQAHLEKVHAQRADLVVTPSRYCAERLDELYHVPNALVIPELIDLDRWRDLLRENPACASSKPRFIVLCVCRFYSRKRVLVLLRAAAILRMRVPELEVRIVGGGPEAAACGSCGESYISRTPCAGLVMLRQANSPPSTMALTCFVCPAFRKDLVLSSSKPWRLASRLSRRVQRRCRKWSVTAC